VPEAQIQAHHAEPISRLFAYIALLKTRSHPLYVKAP
jgi:hypothetical protein